MRPSLLVRQTVWVGAACVVALGSVYGARQGQFWAPLARHGPPATAFATKVPDHFSVAVESRFLVRSTHHVAVADEWAAEPDADTWVTVWEDQPPPPEFLQPHDADSKLSVTKNDVDPKHYISFLHFNIDGLPKDRPFDSARLELYTTASYPDEGRALRVGVHMVTSTWDARTLIPTNIPGYGPSLSGALPDGHVNEWSVWDVTKAVTDWQSGDPNDGLVMAIEENPGARSGIYEFGSAESGHRPRLVVVLHAASAAIYLPYLRQG
jgi:hypothetical protein